MELPKFSFVRRIDKTIEEISCLVSVKGTGFDVQYLNKVLLPDSLLLKIIVLVIQWNIFCNDFEVENKIWLTWK